jgi:cellulose synthase/poly-beta-1,6-N-acetylglucosamine synthase-like glycosyltransferase
MFDQRKSGPRFRRPLDPAKEPARRVSAPPPATKAKSQPVSGMAVVAAVFAAWVAMFAASVSNGLQPNSGPLSIWQWVAAIALHLPYVGILLLFLSGTIERGGYFFIARKPTIGGALPPTLPKVCIQLPMFNEHAVARRIITAAVAIDWPRDRFEVQVLDDSTDPETRDMVKLLCREIGDRSGVTIHHIHRTDRSGYKAGALEAARRTTDAEFFAIFDADFVPPTDYLRRLMPHFFTANGEPLGDLALVQAQWGHLNDDQSQLTAAQALWVDDHHTLQQSWRSAALDFVNFTGTAGTWRASAIEAVGGWSSSSLVEDCELSFRILFGGYRTKFVKEIVAPAELPQSIAAYRSQQKRWTQGWVQLQRLHLARLLFSFRIGLFRKLGLVSMMCIGWQWPLWFVWIAIFPFLIAEGLSLATWNGSVALAVYLAPPLLFAFLSCLAATLESRLGYRRDDGSLRISTGKRLLRAFPYLVINAGMLPLHLCAFVEGLFGPMHAEFERTPKTAAVSGDSKPTAVQAAKPAKAPARKIQRPAYALTEALLVVVQLCWITLFALSGYETAAATAVWLVFGIAVLRLAPPVAAWISRLTSFPQKNIGASA